MKSRNEQLFEILDRIFPSEFEIRTEYDQLGGEHESIISHKKRGTIFFQMSDYDNSDLEDAIWLAEKVGLFKQGYLLQGDPEGNYAIIDSYYHKKFGKGSTIQEAILRAIIEIYGEKNEFRD